ncbi:hypothetical protein KSP35_20965 [Aquihabitans sp. G128]|uniref:hypothetical protein n=1 Tax=Aquihabitans sp. G128 TaxID=2849779 RepID=UPI001C23A54E|nr:hypothetical protein [Aquihabitans sp. G128]QXC60764.1 hypothetical protein KSP35_20965 [Aquihabitans sp. G128]
MIAWLFRNRETGGWTIAQWPNVALGIWLATLVVRKVLDPAGTAGDVVRWVGVAALVVWAIDEIVRGVNPWRRILGATVLAFTVVGLFAG